MNPILTSAMITALTIAIAHTGCAEQKDEDKKPPPQESTTQPAPAVEQKPQDRNKPEERRREAKTPEERREARAPEDQRKRAVRPSEDAVPFIGVVTRVVPPELGAQLGLDGSAGVLVDEVMPDSPAGKAGILKFDVITQLDGERIREPGHLADLVRSKHKGDQVAIQIVRRSATQEIKVAVDERPMPPSFGASPWDRGPHERGPFGPWGYRFERWWQDEPWRDRERERDRGQAPTPDTMDEVFRQSERFMREFQEQQRHLEQQFREYQERFQQQMREFQERMREREREPERKDEPQAPRRDGSAMRRGHDADREGVRIEQPRVHVSVQVPGGGMTSVMSGGIVQREDPSGLYRLEHHPKGEVSFTARTPDGKEQTWPVTTEEQRKAVPEPFRQKLRDLDGVRIDVRPGEEATPAKPQKDEDPETEA